MKEIKELLENLDGVVTAVQIDDDSRKVILDLEKDYEKSSVIGLQNLGIPMVMHCDSVFAILKTTSFRPPPNSTVFLVEELEADDSREFLLRVADKDYRIIGEELLNKKPPEDEDHMYISDDFVLYPDRRINRSGKPAFFLIPPLGFTELESAKEELNIDNIMSISPSTMSDSYIREQFDLPKDTKLATILIGFNTSQSGS